MKIGIDCRKIYDIDTNKGAGVERYTYHFVKNLLKQDRINDFVLFFPSDLSSDTIHKIKQQNSRVKIVKVINSNIKFPILGNHLNFSKLLKKHNLDLTIFTANSIPLFYNRRSFLIVHDVAIFLHPEWFPDKQWFATKVIVPRSLKKAEKIITVSNNTKNDLVELFKLKPEKIKVIYPGVIVKDSYLDVEIDKVKTKFNIQGEYVLFLGTIEPRKNISRVIKAYSNYLFENEHSQTTLIIAGIKGWKFKPIFEKLQDIAKRLPNSQIKYIGQVSNRERNILLKNCKAFIFPSLYEGFGFPVLEAMSLGAPVITSQNSSLAEISGDKAVLVDPKDINDIRKGIKNLLEDTYLRESLIKKGKKYASQFTWHKTVSQFLELIKK